MGCTGELAGNPFKELRGTAKRSEAKVKEKGIPFKSFSNRIENFASNF